MAKKLDKKAVPAISVVIAMYNTEQYITQCLESLLAQTFQDFEVIVADDCSTDNSANIVANIAPKFEGRLKLLRLKKNSGFPGLPRNTAMANAKGKYVAFLDSDDFYEPNALEKFFNTAEQTDADVIHAEKYGTFDEENNPKGVTTFQKGTLVKEPTLETENLAVRVIHFVSWRILWWGINKLFRREFLVKNNIQFPNNITAWEDLVFVFHCILRAKNYVRVPDVVYNYRLRKNSLSHKGRNAFEMMSNLIGSMKAMDKFMEKTEFIQQNPEFRYLFIDWYMQGRLRTICQAVFDFDKLNPSQLNDIFRKKFFSANLSDQVALYSYCFTQTALNKRVLEIRNREIAELKKQIEELKAKVDKDAPIVIPE